MRWTSDDLLHLLNFEESFLSLSVGASEAYKINVFPLPTEAELKKLCEGDACKSAKTLNDTAFGCDMEEYKIKQARICTDGCKEVKDSLIGLPVAWCSEWGETLSAMEL